MSALCVGDGDGDVGSLRNDKFLHFYGHALGFKLFNKIFGDVVGEAFDEFPTAVFAKFEKALADVVIVNGLVDAVGEDGG